jgi:hypothetical protein
VFRPWIVLIPVLRDFLQQLMLIVLVNSGGGIFCLLRLHHCLEMEGLCLPGSAPVLLDDNDEPFPHCCVRDKAVVAKISDRQKNL